MEGTSSRLLKQDEEMMYEALMEVDFRPSVYSPLTGTSGDRPLSPDAHFADDWEHTPPVSRVFVAVLNTVVLLLTILYMKMLPVQ